MSATPSRAENQAVAAGSLIKRQRRAPTATGNRFRKGHSFFESLSLLLRDWLAKPPGSNFERVVCVAIFALIIIMRQPRVLLQGRFWAEEGNVFFERAWNLPWYRALFLPFAGYLNLIANLAGVLAHHFAPLWAAPYVSTTIALLIQCVPAALIVTSRANWLQHRVIVGAALLMIAMMGYSVEISLSSIGSQFYLALAAALVLGFEPRSGAVGALQWFVLLVAPLSGPASWALLPLFALRAFLDRSRARTVQTFILLTGVLLQVIFFYGSATGRGIGISPSLFGGAVLANNVIGPFVQGHLNTAIRSALAASFSDGRAPLWPLGIVTVLGAAAFAALLRLNDKAPVWLFSAGVAMTTIAYAGALGEKSGLLLYAGRYAFSPQVLFELCLLIWCVIHRGSVRFWFGCAFAWLVIVSFLDYRWVQLGPPWRPEVQKWEHDNSYPMKIWPQGWTMTLPGR